MIKLLVMDVDGTLTDGKIYIGENGELMKAFSVQDGYGITHLLKEKGIVPAIITARKSEIVNKRCLELGISEVIQGCGKKEEALISLAEKLSLEKKDGKLTDVAYIGDDIPDLGCMKIVQVSGCPANACKSVKERANYICSANGGNGAVREFIEWLVAEY